MEEKEDTKRKICPGCGLSYSRRYMQKHKLRNKEGGIWLCSTSNKAATFPTDSHGRPSEDLTTSRQAADESGSAIEDDDQLTENNLLQSACGQEEMETADDNSCKEDSDNPLADLHGPLFPETNSSDDADFMESEESINENNSDSDVSSSSMDFDDQANSYSLSNDTAFKNYITLTLFTFLTLWESVFKIPNSAMLFLLKFLNSLFLSIFKFLKPEMGSFSIPTTIHSMWRRVRYSRNPYTKYATCSECFKNFPLEKCVIKIEGKLYSKTCDNIPFPQHPVMAFRTICGNVLVNIKPTTSGKNIITPKKLFCYKSIKETISAFVMRKNFEKDCNAWKTRSFDKQYLTDVYDGKVWEDMQKQGFFQDGDLALMINCDWFRPFKHVQYSIGVIYAVILNLPREKRFLEQNVLVIGILPHIVPEPPLNSFLEPIVTELLEAWEFGFYLDTFHKVKKVKIY